MDTLPIWARVLLAALFVLGAVGFGVLATFQRNDLTIMAAIPSENGDYLVTKEFNPGNSDYSRSRSKWTLRGWSLETGEPIGKLSTTANPRLHSYTGDALWVLLDGARLALADLRMDTWRTNAIKLAKAHPQLGGLDKFRVHRHTGGGYLNGIYLKTNGLLLKAANGLYHRIDPLTQQRSAVKKLPTKQIVCSSPLHMHVHGTRRCLGTQPNDGGGVVLVDNTKHRSKPMFEPRVLEFPPDRIEQLGAKQLLVVDFHDGPANSGGRRFVAGLTRSLKPAWTVALADLSHTQKIELVQVVGKHVVVASTRGDTLYGERVEVTLLDLKKGKVTRRLTL